MAEKTPEIKNKDIAKIITQRNSKLTQKEAELLVEEVFVCIAFALKEGTDVQIKNFGKFHVPPVEEGAMMYSALAGKEVPKKKSVRFKPAKAIKDKVNE